MSDPNELSKEAQPASTAPGETSPEPTLEERLARLRREEVDSSRGGDAVG